jgi:hypothetical protein
MWLYCHDLSSKERPSELKAHSVNCWINLRLRTCRAKHCKDGGVHLDGCTLGACNSPCDTVQTNEQLSLISNWLDWPSISVEVSLNGFLAGVWLWKKWKMKVFQIRAHWREKRKKCKIPTASPNPGLKRDVICLVMSNAAAQERRKRTGANDAQKTTLRRFCEARGSFDTDNRSGTRSLFIGLHQNMMFVVRPILEFLRYETKYVIDNHVKHPEKKKDKKKEKAAQAVGEMK